MTVKYIKLATNVSVWQHSRLTPTVNGTFWKQRYLVQCWSVRVELKIKNAEIILCNAKIHKTGQNESTVE